MIAGFLLFQLIPEQLLGIFNTGSEGDMENIIRVGVPALRRISVSFIFAGFCIVILSVFQALGHGVLSLITSLLRQLGVLLPVAFVIALTTRSLDLMWFAFPVAEIVAVTLSALFLAKVYKSDIKNL